METDPNLSLYVKQHQHMKDTIKEAEERGMKNIAVEVDHVLIELQNKTIKVWYDGKIEDVEN